MSVSKITFGGVWAEAMVDQISSGVSNGSLPPTTSVGAGNATSSSMKRVDV